VSLPPHWLADASERLAYALMVLNHSDSSSGGNREDAPESAAEAEGPQSGAAETAHRPDTALSPSPISTGVE
jgi:hypothetical protein